MSKDPRRADPRLVPTRVSDRLRPQDTPTQRQQLPGLAPLPPGAQHAGQPVNPASRSSNPKLQYPVHFDFLMRHLYERGLVPEEWQIAAADEVRLDETGMEIEFTIVQPKQSLMRRIRVHVSEGKLVRISQ